MHVVRSQASPHLGGGGGGEVWAMTYSGCKVSRRGTVSEAGSQLHRGGWFAGIHRAGDL